MRKDEGPFSLTCRTLLKAGAGAVATPLLLRGAPEAAQSGGPGRAPKRGGSFAMARTAGGRDLSGVNLTRSNFAFIRALYNTLIHLDKGLNPLPSGTST